MTVRDCEFNATPNQMSSIINMLNRQFNNKRFSIFPINFTCYSFLPNSVILKMATFLDSSVGTFASDLQEFVSLTFRIVNYFVRR